MMAASGAITLKEAQRNEGAYVTLNKDVSLFTERGRKDLKKGENWILTGKTGPGKGQGVLSMAAEVKKEPKSETTEMVDLTDLDLTDQ